MGSKVAALDPRLREQDHGNSQPGPWGWDEEVTPRAHVKMELKRLETARRRLEGRTSSSPADESTGCKTNRETALPFRKATLLGKLSWHE